MKKLFSVVLVLALVLAQFTGMLTMTASADSVSEPPAAPAECQLVYSSVMSTQWGGAGSWIWDRSCRQLDASADLRFVDDIEFDIYIEDFDTLSSVASTAGYPMSGYLDAVLSNNNSQYANKYVAAFGSQITQSGWNHVSIPRTSFSTTGAGDLDWAAVTNFAIMFHGNPAFDMGAAANLTVAYTNICATGGMATEIPDCQEDNAVFVSKNGLKNTWGSYLNWLQDRAVVYTLASVDLSAADYIEMDIYITDYNAMVSALTAAGVDKDTYLRIRMHSGGERWSNAGCADIGAQITKSGWNHVKLAKSAFYNIGTGLTNWADVTGFGMFIMNAPQSTASDQPFWIANVRGTGMAYVSAPALDTDNCVVLDQTGLMTSWGGGFTWTADRIYNQSCTPVDWSAAEHVEFDIYIQDYDALVAAYDSIGEDLSAIHLGLGSASGNRFGNRYGASFGAQITKSGWNHIKLEKSAIAFVGSGDLNWSSVCTWMLWNGVGAATNPAGDQNVRIVNLCATGAAYLQLPAIEEDNYRMFDENGACNRWGGAFSWIFDRLYKTGLTAMDFTAAENIELDIYVEDLDNLSKALAAVGYKVTDLQFTLSNGSTKYVNKYAANIGAQITKSGWNHVKFAKSGFASTGAGTLDWSAITGWAFLLAGNPGVSTGSAANDLVWVGNVRATAEAFRMPDSPAAKNYVDTTVSTAKIGARVKAGLADFAEDFDEALDTGVSYDNGYIEFDYYVADLDLYNEAMELSDITGINLYVYDGEGNGATGAFGDQIVAEGWNHIVLALGDFVQDDDDAAFDPSDLCGWSLAYDDEAEVSAEAGDVKICMTNLIAATHIMGDVNKDGEVDIKDLVRMKKFAADATVVLDDFAADLNGADGVSAADLALLRTELLG